jgi:hypothetical protein
MKEAMIASAVAAGLLIVFGLEGCGPGKFWDQSHIFKPPASPSVAGASRRSDSPAQLEELTEEDRAELARLIEKLN